MPSIVGTPVRGDTEAFTEAALRRHEAAGYTIHAAHVLSGGYLLVLSEHMKKDTHVFTVHRIAHNHTGTGPNFYAVPERAPRDDPWIFGSRHQALMVATETYHDELTDALEAR